MLLFPLPPSHRARTRSRTALVASADSSFRQRLSETLIGCAGRSARRAAALRPGAPLKMPLRKRSFSTPGCRTWTWRVHHDFRGRFPQTDLITASVLSPMKARGPFRQELLYALRRCQDTDTAVWKTAPELDGSSAVPAPLNPVPRLRASWRQPPWARCG